MQVTNNVSYAPAIVNVDGATKTERQLSVVHTASAQTKMALVAAKGKLGLAARSGFAHTGLVEIAKAAARNNYKPAAEYFAARLGQPMVISGRAAFESLPDFFEIQIMKAKMSKSGGWQTCKKTGAQKPSATHALALELKSIAIDLNKHKEAAFAEMQQSRAAIAA